MRSVSEVGAVCITCWCLVKVWVLADRNLPIPSLIIYFGCCWQLPVLSTAVELYAAAALGAGSCLSKIAKFPWGMPACGVQSSCLCLMHSVYLCVL